MESSSELDQEKQRAMDRKRDVILGRVALLAAVTGWSLVLGLRSDFWMLAVVTAAAYGIGYALELRKGRWFLSADAMAIPFALVAYLTTLVVLVYTSFIGVPVDRPYLLTWMFDVLMDFGIAWFVGHALGALLFWLADRIGSR